MGTQKAESLRKDFEHALGKQNSRALGILLENVEDDLVLAHRAEVFDADVAGHLVQVAHGHRLKLGDI